MLGGTCFEGVVEQYVLVERIILGSILLFGYRIVDWCLEVYFLGQESSQIGLHCHIIALIVVEIAVAQTLVYRTEAHCLLVVAGIHCGNVAHAQSHVCFGCPTAVLVEVGHTEFVCPHGALLGGAGVVANTYHYHFHIAQRRITEHGNLVLGLRRVVLGEAFAIRHAGHALQLLCIAVLLNGGKHIEVAIEHIRLGPYCILVAAAIRAVIRLRRCHRQWNFIFVVIVFNIRTQTDKCRHFAIAQRGGIVDERFVVQEHLQAAIDAQVEAGVLIHGTRCAGGELGNLHRHRLLVELCDLRLTGIHYTGHARRQNVVHRLASGVLFDVDGCHCQVAFGRHIDALVGVIVVAAPFALEQLERGKTQVDGLFEIGEEHAYEAYGGEIAHRAHHLLIVA